MITKIMPSPFPTTPVFVISMEKDGDYLRSAFQCSRQFADLGTIFDPRHQAFWAHRQNILMEQSTDGASSQNCEVSILESFLRENLDVNQSYTFVDINYRALNRIDTGDQSNSAKPTLIKWLIRNRYPVVHLVRKNPLDCFVDSLLTESRDMERDDVPLLNISAAVQLIRQMQNDVAQHQRWLADSNRIEFFTESLLSKDGQPSRLIVHQFSKFLGIDSSSVQVHAITRKAKQADGYFALQLKSQLRPALIRAGCENLYELPRAA